jgi:actin-related protein 5
LDDLEEYLNKIEKSVTRAKNKELGIEEESKVGGLVSSNCYEARLTHFSSPFRLTTVQEAPSFPLIDVPDHMLNESDLKEKRKQKLMKAGYDARSRMKAERDEEKRRTEEERQRDEELRIENFGAWVAGVRREHQVRSPSALTLACSRSLRPPY